MLKQAHIKELPLLDGTYDFAEVQLSFGRKVHIPLLDVSALLSSVESDSSEGNINLMVTVITAYITKLSNETILISVTDRTAKERDASVWRALAEMNMTQLSQALKQTVQEHKMVNDVSFSRYMGCLYYFNSSYIRNERNHAILRYDFSK